MEEEEVFTFQYNGCDTYLSRTVRSAFLPKVLDAFRDFLRRAGYDYVDEVVAVSENSTHHSSDDV